MRRFRILAAVVGILIAGPAFAQVSPGIATILKPDVDVRSGPSTQYYPTAKLRQGDRVTVLRAAKDPNWLEVVPPTGSFSWINSKFVQRVEGTPNAVVNCDPSRPAPIMTGSRIHDAAPNVTSMNLTQGTIVVIIGNPMQAGGDTWLPIQPHQNEVRYLPAEAVKQSTVVATQTSSPNWTQGGAMYSTNSMLADAEKARLAGDNVRARQLYEQVINTSPDQNHKMIARQALDQMSPNYFTPTSNAKPDQTRTAFSANNVPASLQELKKANWTSYGRLYETKLTSENGQPLYELDLGQGQRVYVSTIPGKSLQSYVGRTVSVYGPTMYRPDAAVRLPFVVVSHVAVP